MSTERDGGGCMHLVGATRHAIDGEIRVWGRYPRAMTVSLSAADVLQRVGDEWYGWYCQ